MWIVLFIFSITLRAGRYYMMELFLYYTYGYTCIKAQPWFHRFPLSRPHTTRVLGECYSRCLYLTIMLFLHDSCARQLFVSSGNLKLKFLISTSHLCYIRRRRETAVDSASKNNRRALRLNTSRTTRQVQRLPNIRRVHESCGTGFIHAMVLWSQLVLSVVKSHFTVVYIGLWSIYPHNLRV